LFKTTNAANHCKQGVGPSVLSTYKMFSGAFTNFTSLISSHLTSSEILNWTRSTVQFSSVQFTADISDENTALHHYVRLQTIAKQ